MACTINQQRSHATIACEAEGTASHQKGKDRESISTTKEEESRKQESR
jgi:hypothetical protein